jgi:hypothetical protein
VRKNLHGEASQEQTMHTPNPRPSQRAAMMTDAHAVDDDGDLYEEVEGAAPDVLQVLRLLVPVVALTLGRSAGLWGAWRGVAWR